MSLLITESEKRRILGLHEKVKSDSYVFDFVLTENHKYLIYMDNVFVKGGNGKSIGSIWENTHIFNEILNESLKKKNILSEEIKNTINNFQWSKETVESWLNDKTELTENWLSDQWNSTWNNLKDGKEASSALFKGEIVPFLRWVRKMSMTNMGIVLDIIGTFFLAKSTMIVWGMIVLLDIYEIATNNIGDDRKDSPYIGLMCDVAGLVLMGVAAKSLKVASKNIATKGITNPSIIKTLKNLLSKIPGVKSMLDKVGSMLIKVFPKGGMVQKMLGYSTNILKKLSSFIDGLLKKGGQKVGKKVATQSAVGVGLNTALGGSPKSTRSYESDKALIKKVFALNESTNIDEQLVKRGLQKLGDGYRKLVGKEVDMIGDIGSKSIARSSNLFKKDLETFLLKNINKKWYQVFKKNPNNIDEFIENIFKDRKMTEHIADLTHSKFNQMSKVRFGDITDINKLTRQQLVIVRDAVKKELYNNVSKTIGKLKTGQGLKGRQERLLQSWDDDLINLYNKKINIPNFSAILKESMSGSRIRLNALQKSKKITRTGGTVRNRAVNPRTGKPTIVKTGSMVYKIVCNIGKLKTLGLLGITGYGLYQFYQLYNDTIGVENEELPVVFVDENDNPLDPETLTPEGNDSESTENTNSDVSNLPTELQDMIANDGAEFISSPREGIYIKNDDYPEGIYLFSDGVAQDVSTGEEGTWTQ